MGLKNPPTRQEMMEQARNAAGNAPSWEVPPARMTITLADGTVWEYADISLVGIADILNIVGVP